MQARSYFPFVYVIFNMYDIWILPFLQLYREVNCLRYKQHNPTRFLLRNWLCSVGRTYTPNKRLRVIMEHKALSFQLEIASRVLSYFQGKTYWDTPPPPAPPGRAKEKAKDTL